MFSFIPPLLIFSFIVSYWYTYPWYFRCQVHVLSHCGPNIILHFVWLFHEFFICLTIVLTFFPITPFSPSKMHSPQVCLYGLSLGTVWSEKMTKDLLHTCLTSTIVKEVVKRWKSYSHLDNIVWTAWYNTLVTTCVSASHGPAWHPPIRHSKPYWATERNLIWHTRIWSILNTSMLIIINTSILVIINTRILIIMDTGILVIMNTSIDHYECYNIDHYEHMYWSLCTNIDHYEHWYIDHYEHYNIDHYEHMYWSLWTHIDHYEHWYIDHYEHLYIDHYEHRYWSLWIHILIIMSTGILIIMNTCILIIMNTIMLIIMNTCIIMNIVYQ